jgi:hypothetical protein
MSRKARTFSGQSTLPCLAHAFQARPDAAAGFGDFFVGSALDALFKIHQPRLMKTG